MLKVNDAVMYGSMGVCLIDRKEIMKIDKQQKEYYILKLVSKPESLFYVPVDSAEVTSKIRKVLSVDEIFEAIRQATKFEDIWVKDNNERKVKFGEIISSGNRMQLMLLARSLYHHKIELENEGKKFHASDERYLKEAFHLLSDEFSYVLNLKPEQVGDFIKEQISIIKKEKHT